MTQVQEIHVEPGKIKDTSWKDYGIRFLFGGIITAAVGILAKAFGPVVAGLFLAFPAILPASLTLVSKHDGDSNAGWEADGAAIGSVGLLLFGIVIWGSAASLPGIPVLLIATAAWFTLSVLLWAIIQYFRSKSSRIDHRSNFAVQSSDQRWGVAKR